MNHAQRALRPAPRFFQMLLLALVAMAASATSAAGAAGELETQIEPLLAAGKFAEAQAIAQKAADADPKNAEAQYYLGVALIEQNNYADATPRFENAIALAPNVSKYHRGLGDACGLAALHGSGVFHKLGMARKSKAAYEKAVALDPASVNARESLINYLWEAPAIAGGGKEKAFAQIDELEKINPPAGRVQRLAYCIKDKKYADARALLATELAANPDNYLALYQTGQIAALSGENLDAGAAALQRCLTLTPPAGAPSLASVHYQLGAIAERKGDKSAARASYQAALALEPALKEAKTSLDRL